MKRISILQPIIDAIDETDASLSRFQGQMLKWAKYIEREIGSKLAYKYKAKLFIVTGCTIDLPDDCYRPVMLLPGDYEDECNARYLDVDWLPIRQEERDDETFNMDWLWRPAESTVLNGYLWEEVAEQLNLPYSYDSQEMTLVYQYLEVDERGYWLINETHSEAIKRYIIYKIAKKYNWKIFKSDKLLRQGHLTFVEQLSREYNIAVRHARAEDGRESPYEREQY